jgi:hypothetical protein
MVLNGNQQTKGAKKMGMQDMKNVMESIKASTRNVSLKITNPTLRAELEDLHNRSVQIMQTYKTGAESVDTNTTLSQLGKQEAKRSLMTTTLDDLAKIDAAAEKYNREVERVLASISDDTSENAVLDYMVQREIRDRVTNDTTLEVQYAHAVNTNTNQLLVDALENDPLPRDFVTVGTRSKTRQNKLMVSSPKDALRVKDIDLYKACLKNTTDAARHIISQYQ